MRAAHDFIIGPDGHLYVTTVSHPELGSAVQVWDLASGTMLRHIGSYAELAAATGATLGPDDLLYLCDYERDQILRFDPLAGALVDVLVAPGAGLVDPLSLDFGPDGALHVLDSVGIHRVDPATGELLDLLVAIGDGHLQGPRSFTFVTESALGGAR
jgi:streptogramin lyase